MDDREARVPEAQTSTTPPAESSAKPSTPEATAATAQSRVPKEMPAGKEVAAKPGALFTLGKGVSHARFARSYSRKRDDPVYRPLKIYTTDPSTRRLEGAAAVINVPYETLKPGPKGTRFSVETSPHSPFDDFQEVDLDDKRILIRSGREPAPSDPVFHHQMVYAICSSVYAAFRTAMGRELAWGFEGEQLRVIPHGMQEKDAEYSQADKSLSFGWYQAEDSAIGRLMPKGYVFACLSHDIIAHELTHALLDGLRAEFRRSVSPDTAAFHEGFADLVALFQRFSYEGVVKNAIRATGGKLTGETFLLHLAKEFGQGFGEAGGIRSVDVGENPKPYCPDCESHELGSRLVSAVFDAFLTVYARRAAPYFRLASEGTGILRPGQPPGDLIDILAHLLSRLASQFLSICIRAIDYCPPVNIMFGEYLRALVTADFDLVPDDPWAYREALIEAFGRRRIFPPGVKSLSEEALLWRGPKTPLKVKKLDYATLKFSGDPGSASRVGELRRQATALGDFITRPENRKSLGEFGLAAEGDAELRGDKVDVPTIESIRSSRRVGPDGQLVFDLVAEVTQRRHASKPGEPVFEFYGGSTIILDPHGEIRYIIRKSVVDNEQLEAQRAFWTKSNFDTYSLQHCLLARTRKPAPAGASAHRRG
jgi:hypothetical protein